MGSQEEHEHSDCRIRRSARAPEGILSVAWNPHDDGTIVSCGKDDRTLVWDLYHAKVVRDLTAEEQKASAGGAGANGAVWNEPAWSIWWQ